LNFEDVLKGRRSIRKYRSAGIPDSLIEGLLDSARYAPSSMNGQPWRFGVVRDLKTKEQLSEIKNKYCPVEKLKYSADFMVRAPAIIIVCVDRATSYDREVENGVLASSYILLSASAKGLGAVYMSAYKRGEPKLTEEIRDLLNIPDALAPINLIPIGFPDELPIPKTLVPLKELVNYETFGP